MTVAIVDVYLWIGRNPNHPLGSIGAVAFNRHQKRPLALKKIISVQRASQSLLRVIGIVALWPPVFVVYEHAVQPVVQTLDPSRMTQSPQSTLGESNHHRVQTTLFCERSEKWVTQAPGYCASDRENLREALKHLKSAVSRWSRICVPTMDATGTSSCGASNYGTSSRGTRSRGRSDEDVRHGLNQRSLLVVGPFHFED